MDIPELSKLVDDLNYLLARISKYLKNNQYVYLRAFDSWQDSYNLAVAQLNTDRNLCVPAFNLNSVDYSPSGKSINQECVGRFVKTINLQVLRLEDKINELNKAAEEKLAHTSPLESFFHHAEDVASIVPPAAEQRIFIAIPPGEANLKLFWQGIQPALEAQGLSFFRADRSPINDTLLCEICQELHSCRLAIFDLSGQAPNVMLALGHAYGIGKPVIILRHQNDETLGERNNHGYVCYAGADELKTSLRALLPQLLASCDTTFFVTFPRQ